MGMLDSFDDFQVKASPTRKRFVKILYSLPGTALA